MVRPAPSRSSHFSVPTRTPFKRHSQSFDFCFLTDLTRKGKAPTCIHPQPDLQARYSPVLPSQPPEMSEEDQLQISKLQMPHKTCNRPVDTERAHEKGREQRPQNLPTAVRFAPLPSVQLPPTFPLHSHSSGHSWGRKPPCTSLRSS